MKLAWVAAVVALSMPALAHAQGKTEAEKIADEAQAAYDKKQYKQAADTFMFAYQKEQNPIYLFNAAQAYRFDGKSCAASLDAYKRFLDAVKGQDIPNLDRVQGYITEMEKCAANASQTPDVTPPPNNPPPNHPPPVEPKTQPNQPKATVVEHPTRKLGYALIVGGGAVFVGGLAFTGLTLATLSDAKDLKGDIETTCGGMPQAACETAHPGISSKFTSLDNDNKNGPTYEKLEIVGLSVGAAALAAGVYFTLKGHTAKEQMVTVSPTKDGAAVVGTWHF